jgi:hypothetical protein
MHLRMQWKTYSNQELTNHTQRKATASGQPPAVPLFVSGYILRPPLPALARLASQDY